MPRLLSILLVILLALWTRSGAATPLEANGRLKTCGATLCNESGSKVQLRGMSSHGLSWFGQYMNGNVIKWLVDDWGISVIRAAMYTGEGGYVDNPSSRASLEAKVDTIVNAATANGIYALVDWHILSEQDPHKTTAEAVSFFSKMAAKYKGNKNVLYEICNEPNGSATWAGIKSYADTVIPAIRAIDPNAVIVVGTPTWSQDVDAAAQSPLSSSYGNIAYALHFYAGSHGEDLRNKARTALRAGLPLFVTEWGTTAADGGVSDPTVYTAAATTWLKFLDSAGISWCNWSLADKAEASAALVGGASVNGSWPLASLTTSGKFVRTKILAALNPDGPFKLEATATAGGSVVVSPSGTSFAKGTAVTVQAYPEAGYVFAGWSGDNSSLTNPLALTVTGDVSLQAEFLKEGENKNLVTNGNFVAGNAGWSIGWWGGAGSTAYADSTFTAVITAGGTEPWNVQLSQAGIPLVNGHNYELLFDVAASHDRVISPNVGMASGAYTSYANWNPLGITTARTRHRLTFTMAQASDASSRLEFNLGTDTGTVALRNVVLREVGAAAGNVAPSLKDSTLSVAKDSTLRFSLWGSDVEGPVAGYSLAGAARHGVATLTGARVVYVPNAGYTGNDTLQVTVQDDSGATSTGRILIVVSSRENQVKNGTFTAGLSSWSFGTYSGAAATTTVADSSFTARITAPGSAEWNVQFTQGGMAIVNGLEYELLFEAQASHPRTINPNVGMGSGSYASYANWAPLSIGTQRATYRMSFRMASATDLNSRLEFNLGLDTGTVTLRNIVLREVVTAVVNTAPHLSDSILATSQDATRALKLWGADAEGGTLTYAVTTVPGHGAAVVSHDTLFYTPEAGYLGTDSLRLTATDEAVATSEPARLLLAVLHRNHAPVTIKPIADLALVQDQLPSRIALATVFQDADGDTLTYAVVHKDTALLVIGLDGTYLNLSPKRGAWGTDTVLVRAGDGALSVTDTVIVQVRRRNKEPVIRDQHATTTRNSPIQLLLTATDSDGAVIRYGVVSPPIAGSVRTSKDTLYYAPVGGFIGMDGFDVVAYDDSGAASAKASVRIDIVGNRAPVILKGITDIVSSQGALLSSHYLATVFKDPDGDALEYTVTHKDTSLLNASITGPYLRLASKPGRWGIDTVIVQAKDWNDSVADTVIVTQWRRNQAPALEDVDVTMEQAKVLRLKLGAVDTDGVVAKYVLAATPSFGTAKISNDTLIYTPTASHSGIDWLRVAAMDDSGASSRKALVRIEVLPTPSVFAALSRSVEQGALCTLSLAGMDTSRKVVGYKLASLPSKGTATLRNDTLFYAAPSDWYGMVSFNVSSLTATGAVSRTVRAPIEVRKVNKAPYVKTPFKDVFARRDSVLLSQTLGFADPESDPLTYSVRHVNPRLVAVDLVGTTLRYGLNPGQFGEDTLFVTAKDASLEAVDTMVIQVRNVNNAPTLRDTCVQALQGETVRVRLSGRDLDGAVSYRIAGVPYLGTAELQGEELVYVPKATTVGMDRVRVVAVDDSGVVSRTALVAIEIVKVNRAPVVTTPLADVSIGQGSSIGDRTLGFTDPNGDVLTYEVAHTGNVLASVSLVGKVLRLSQKPGAWGIDTVIAKATDGEFAVSDTFFVTVGRRNVVPWLADAALEARSGDTTRHLLAATDADGKVKFYALAVLPLHGKALVRKDTLLYVPTVGYEGADSLKVYAVDDSGKASRKARIEFLVKPAAASVALSGTTPLVVAARAALAQDLVEESPVTESVLPATVDTVAVNALSSVVRVSQVTTRPGAVGWSLAECSEESPCQKAQLLLPSVASLDVQIFDQIGTPVLAWNRVLTAIEFAALAQGTDGRRALELGWNLHSSSGSLVASGVYLWKVRVTTDDGRETSALLKMGVTR